MNPQEMLRALASDPLNTLKNGTQKAIEVVSGLFAVFFVVESVKYSVNELGYTQDMADAAMGRETVETTSRMLIDSTVRGATLLFMRKTGFDNVVYKVGGKIVPGMLKLAGEGVVHAVRQNVEDVRESINNKIEYNRIPVAKPVGRVTLQ